MFNIITQIVFVSFSDQVYIDFIFDKKDTKLYHNPLLGSKVINDKSKITWEFFWLSLGIELLETFKYK